MHVVLADFIDNHLEESVYPVALADELAYYSKQGPDRGALWRFIRERKFGRGFVDRTIADHKASWDRFRSALTPFEEQLGNAPFLTGRIGLADFALYGQLYYLAFTGELKIPSDMKNLRAFFGRVDRITSTIDESTG
jgi:glutathione S-transferase